MGNGQANEKEHPLELGSKVKWYFQADLPKSPFSMQWPKYPQDIFDIHTSQSNSMHWFLKVTCAIENLGTWTSVIHGSSKTMSGPTKRCHAFAPVYMQIALQLVLN